VPAGLDIEQRAVANDGVHYRPQITVHKSNSVAHPATNVIPHNVVAGQSSDDVDVGRIQLEAAARQYLSIKYDDADPNGINYGIAYDSTKSLEVIAVGASMRCWNQLRSW
jgi:hypothetical protein